MAVSRGYSGRSLYTIIHSEDYITNNGFALYGYDNKLLDGKIKSKADFMNSEAKRLRVRGPLMDIIPQELSLSWGQSSLQEEINQSKMLNQARIAESIQNRLGAFGNAVKLGIGYIVGSSNQNIAGTVQAVDGYHLPEMQITTLLSYYGNREEEYRTFINNLIGLATPLVNEGTLTGKFGHPEDYHPPKDFQPSFNFTELGPMKALPLDKACAVMLGKNRFIKGLVVSGVSLIPSNSVTTGQGGEMFPLYIKVVIRLQGARVMFKNEQQNQWNFNEGISKNGETLEGVFAKPMEEHNRKEREMAMTAFGGSASELGIDVRDLK